MTSLGDAVPDDDGPGQGAGDEHKMSFIGRLSLGMLLLVVGGLLLYLIITLWPALDAAKLGKSGHFTWFWHRFVALPDATLMLFVALVSALGSYIHVTVSFSSFVGNRNLASSWTWWYLLRVFVGSALAVIFYFAVRGGFMTGGGDSKDVNIYGIGALSGMVGLFSKQATDKLREIFETAFKVGKGYGDDARADNLSNPVPKLTGVEPASLAVAGAASVTLDGEGFIATSQVSVTMADGTSPPATTTYNSATRVTVVLAPGHVAIPGALTFKVTNPPPGGGTSQPLIVQVA
jgi:hypothetical protein